MPLRPLPLSFLEPLEDRLAPATLVGHNLVTYTDADGDTVTLKISKPLFTADNVNNVLHFDTGTVDGANTAHQQLQLIDLTQLAGASGLNLTVTAQQATGGDGHADIGYIKAGTFSSGKITGGIDLGAVNIMGDLGRIDVGNNNALPGIASLKVLSLGARGTATQDSISTPNLASHIQGPAGTINVAGDVNGASISLLDAGGVVGSGDLGVLKITGSLKGGATANSGLITFTGTIGKATIDSIVGGEAANSGLLSGSYGTLSKITSLSITNGIAGGTATDTGEVSAYRIASITVGADVAGGSGGISGVVQAAKLGQVTINGSLIGSSGGSSGEIFGDTINSINIAHDVQGGTAGTATSAGLSGVISAATKVGSIKIGGSLIGGNFVDDTHNANNSGAISVNGNIGSLTIGNGTTGTGNVVGGTGSNSGVILAIGTLGPTKILGNLTGANSTDTMKVVNSGYLQAAHLPSLFVGGNVVAGSDLGGGIDSSGAIRSEHEIGTLTIGGNLQGGTTTTGINPAIISAVGQQKLAAGSTTDLAIKSVSIGGDMTSAEILAGYNTDTTGQTLARGAAVNADASIGTVKITGNMTASSIVAGVTAGGANGSGFFGDSNDALASGVSTTNRLNVISKISSVIVSGTGSGTAAADDDPHFGIVAQQVVAVSVHSAPIDLLAGASNDIAMTVAATDKSKPIGDTLGTNTGTSDAHDFHVVEVV